VQDACGACGATFTDDSGVCKHCDGDGQGVLGDVRSDSSDSGIGELYSEVQGEFPKKIIKAAAQVMDIGCKVTGNGQLSKAAISTYLSGTAFASYASWLLEKKRFHVYDNNNSGSLDMTELCLSMVDFQAHVLGVGESSSISKRLRSTDTLAEKGRAKKEAIMHRMRSLKERHEPSEDGPPHLELQKEFSLMRQEVTKALKVNTITRRDLIEAGFSEFATDYAKQEEVEEEAPQRASREPPPYGHATYAIKYWDARHSMSGELPFDWYMDYNKLGPILRRKIMVSKTQTQILDLGFGTSEVPARLHGDGWKNVTGIDISAAAVSRARIARRHAALDGIKFLQMDACKLGFPVESFDLVIDKATFDTIVCSGFAFTRATDLLSEVYRVLKPAGIYFLISHAGVAVRLPYLVADPEKPWKIELLRVEKPPLDGPPFGEEDEEFIADAGSGFYHIYMCTKPTQARDVVGHR